MDKLIIIVGKVDDASNKLLKVTGGLRLITSDQSKLKEVVKVPFAIWKMRPIHQLPSTVSKSGGS